MPRVTIVPADSLVIVDGRGLHVDCSGLAQGVHAVQWDGQTGEVERHGEPNEVLDLAGYATHVAPLYAAWEAAREAADATPPLPDPITTRRADIHRELDTIDLQSVRSLRAKLSDTAAAEDERILSELESRAAALRTELATLV